MKRQHVVLAIAAFNFGMLGLAALAIGANAQAPELKQQPYQAARVNWSSTSAQAPLPAWGDAVLSPTKRPVTETTTTTTTTVEQEPTDDELRVELKGKFAREVRLLRILFAEGDPNSCFAKVRLGSREIVLAPNSGFYDSVPESIAKTLPAWLRDVQVGEISPLGLKLNAASRKPEKRFELTLTLKEPGTITVGPHRVEETEARKAPPSVRELRDVAKVEITKTTRNPDGSLTLGSEDFTEEAIEAACNALRVVVDENGEPIGLQISEETPEDNVLIRRGSKRGDIIKSVNGKPVKKLADAKRIVREEHDAGKREFEIGYERDGAPHSQIIRAPK
ncbi:MAG: hypothetical protein KBG84_05860 [Planctomycetes bacterium]|nr:hypothetical protein [Planctomycetota bacterium]